MPRPIQATFSAAAWRHNLAVVRRRAPHSRVWAVVKANAYGHGLARAASALDHADGFALLDLHEAVRLRELGVTKPILLLEGFFEARDLDGVIAHELWPVVHCEAQLRMLEEAQPERLSTVFLKINSGMNRLGFTGDAVRTAHARLQALRRPPQIVLMTHFADADGPLGVMDQQARFDEWTQGLVCARSLANSAATLRYPQTHADWVRPGIALYGASPFPDEDVVSLGLKPVMTLRSQLIATQTLRAGEGIGYGFRYRAAQTMRIGVVACGYADGYPRHAPAGNDAGAPILVDGVCTRTIGRVAMDMLYVDLTSAPQAKVGTTVTLWGDGLPADEVATACGTVSYELFCALTQRVPAIELNNLNDLD